MNNQEIEVLKIVNASLHNLPYEPSCEYDYNSILNEMSEQSVLPFGMRIITKIIFSDDERDIWKNKILAIIAQNTRLIHEEAKLCKLIDEADIKYAIIKGTASAYFYPNPELRQLGDIDILVAPKDYDNTREIFEKHGYRVLSPDRPITRNDPLFSNTGIEVEIHQSYFGNWDMAEPDSKDEMLFKRLDKCQLAKIKTHTFPVFQNREHGIILLHHLIRHLNEGIGLRHILDWIVFVDTVCDNEFWYNELEPIAKEYNLINIARITTYIGKKYFDLSKEITWCDDVDEAYCNQFLDYIFHSGNFGRKEKKADGEYSQVLISKKSISDWFTYLQRSGMKNWIYAQNHSFVRPFAWLYQIGRIIHVSLSHKNMFSLITIGVKSRNKKKLFEYIGAK